MMLCGFNRRISAIGRIAIGALLVLSVPIASDGGSWGKSLGTVRFEVTDARQRSERDIGSRLLLRVSRVPHVRLANFGWVVEVLEHPVGENAVNLLYHSLSWHGPYPTDIMAWHVGERVFPDDRVVRVQGHPYEVRITLSDIKVAGTGENKEFVSGSGACPGVAFDQPAPKDRRVSELGNDAASVASLPPISDCTVFI